MNNLVELKASRELDALVAEVMGDLPPRGYSIPDYSTFISVALEVVEKIQPCHFELIHWADSDRWQCNIGGGPMTRYYEMCQADWQDTAPLAICLAVLKAVVK